MKLLNIKNLDFEKKKKPIIKNLNFSLNKGEVLSILGPSGSGKSTILKLLAGFLKPTAGQITMLNKLIASNKLLIPPKYKVRIELKVRIWIRKILLDFDLF